MLTINLKVIGLNLQVLKKMLLLKAFFRQNMGRLNESVIKQNQTMNKITNGGPSNRGAFKNFLLNLSGVFFLLVINSSYGQSFLGLNGGFEGTATIDNTNVYTVGQANMWVKANATQTITSETTVVRSGGKSLKLNNTSTSGRRLFTPTFSPASGQRLVIQYYRRSASVTNTQQSQSMISFTGVANNESTSGSYLGVSAANTWEKVVYAPTNTTSAVNLWAGLLHRQTGTGGDSFIDDVAVYVATAADVTAPNAPGVITFSGQTTSSIDLSWAAATGGVDNGGYLVVRSTTDPTTTPNVNGIYAVSNTIGSGTVVYQGTGTSFTDSGLNPSTTYYYRVYTFDKAYNYSSATTGNSATTASFSIGWANLQYPTANTSVAEGTAIDYYGRVYAAGVTDSVGEGTLIDAWVGYSTSNTDPSGSGWTWVSAAYNVDDGASNDEYKGTLSGLTPATYYVTYRYRVGATGAFTYGGKNSNVWASTSDNAQLTVTSLLVDWCNVQYPTSGTITAGDAYNVYAKVYLGGVTNTGSPGAGISAWIGYSTSNTNPNTWTNWVPATFGSDQGNDDEYFANIATGLTPGTYYYASRFQRTGSTEYRYGDINGIWDTTADNGVLTVNAATPVVTPASPTGTYNTAFSYNVVASNTPTSFAVASGTLPTGLSLNTTTGLISGTPTQVGTFAIGVTASNGGGTSPAATITITIGQASQTITFGALASKVYGDAAFALTATASSGLTVSYTSSNTAVATVSGDTVTIVGVGTTTITASQAGDTNYTAAAAVDQTLTVTVKNLIITGVTANDKVEDGTTTATLSGAPGLSGLVAGDESEVSITGTPSANFASALPGTGIAVTVTGYSLAGTKSANYSVSQPTGLTANITALGVPTATAATAVLPVGFTANWNAVSGAVSYVLDVSTNPDFQTVTNTTDLIISEYVEGSSNNKYVEIFNGTGAAVDLSNYELRLYTNGASTPSNTNVLSGTLANNTTVVYKNASATVYTGSATNQTSVAFNGDDAVALYKISTASFVDIFGRIGEDPGASWTSGAFTTVDKTLVRNSNITSGVTITSGTTGFPTLATEWTQSNIDVVTNLGAHSYNAVTSSFVNGYNGLDVGNVTSYQVTGLDPETTYYYRVRAVSGSVNSANSNSISVTTKPVSCTWNGTIWTNTTGPDADIEAVIAGVYSTAANGEFTAKKVTVNSGSLTVNSGNSITVVNEVVNNLTAADVVVENNANLIQTADVDNTGAVTVKRNSSLLKRLDYTLWSSPVVGQNLLSFSPQTITSRFYTYNSSTNFYESVPNPSTTTFDAGKGFLIRVPNNHPAVTPTAFAGQFVGVPHNGDYSVTMQDAVAGERFNLVGNPYPSPINALSFIEDNNNSGSITGTLYFWRKTNGSANPSYCTWTSGGFVTNNDDQTFDLNEVIQTGQAFFVEATGNNNQLLFTNAMRTDNSANQFFRNAQTTTAVERHRVWLNATNDAGAFSQTMIGYMSNASNGLDAQIDGKYINDGEIAFTSLLDANPMAIQGRALPFDAADVVPMRFKANSAGTYTIAIDHADGMFANNQTVFLRDNVLGVTHNLNDGAYTFAAEAGTFDSRFEVVYQSTLGTDTPTLTQNQVVVYAADASGITVTTGTIVMNSIKVFDIRGRLLTESNAINASQATLVLPATNQVVLLQITAVTGETITKKFVK